MNLRSDARRAGSPHFPGKVGRALPSLAVVLIGGLLPNSVQAAVTFADAEVTAIAASDLRAGDRGSTQNSVDTAFAAQDLFAESNAVVHNGPADNSSTHATATGSFADPTQGVIMMVGSGSLKTDSRPDSPFALNEWSMGYSYDFVIDQAEPFTFDYSVLASASPLAPADGFVLFEPYEFSLTNAASGVVATGSFSSGDTGRVAIPLGFDGSVPQSGAYHLEVKNFTRGFLGVQSSVTFNSTGNFDFKIGGGALNDAASVPEPSSWMMMIVGFGLAGSMARRRQRPAQPGRRG